MSKLLAISIIMLLTGLLVACGAKAPVATVAQTPPVRYQNLELPEKITPDERLAQLRELYLLPDDHPSRLPLRDLVAASYAASFAALPADKVEARLALFRDAVAIHAPADFAKRDLSVALVPAAREIAATHARRGEETVVLAALAYLSMAEPGQAAHAQRFDELSGWSEKIRETLDGDLERLSSLVMLYRDVVALVPGRAIVDRVAELQLLRHRAVISRLKARAVMRGDQGASDLEMAFSVGAMQELPSDLIHAFFVSGEVTRARPWLAELVADGELRVDILQLLDDIVAGRDAAENWFALGVRLIGPRDHRAMLRACVLARRLEPREPRFSLCVGEAFEELGDAAAAVTFFVEAGRNAPTEEVLGPAMEATRAALYKVHMAEEMEIARTMTREAEVLITLAGELPPEAKDAELDARAAALLYTLGEIEFDDGRISEAEGHLARSVKAFVNIPARVKLAEIHYLRGRFAEALGVLEEILRSDGREVPDHWRAIVLERRGDSLLEEGDRVRAEASYREAIRAWKEATLPPEQRPSALVRTGVMLDRLGELAPSRAAFRQALALDPERRASYAEILSFLVTTGRLEEAQAIYRLAFNQDSIEPMWKTYYSLWVEGLARRLGRGSFELALGYLESRGGETWQDDLARYFTGRMTIADLRSRARTVGQKVEADFYEAVLRLADKKVDEGRGLLDRVVAADLMGFFEYRMARSLLAEKN